jgi:hypothetical protein
MTTIDLAIAWNWEYDASFVKGIEAECAKRKLTTLNIETTNLMSVLPMLRSNDLSVRVLFDRASDADEAFLPLQRLLLRQEARIINPPERVAKAIDKAVTHLELLKRGLNVPYTIIVSPYIKKREISLGLSVFEHLGKPFIIKPANTTGGGTGVVMGAETLKEILDARQHHISDKYLLQETIIPAPLGEKRGWFRVFYFFGEVIPCWWNDRTKTYSELTPADEQTWNLRELRSTSLAIQDICKLDFFSSEIARTADGRFVVVDYVNEVCDMRLRSEHADGVPDRIVHQIESLLADEVARGAGNHVPDPTD